MQYTSKIALLAVALFGTSALAAPFGGEVDYDLETREVDNDLSARDFYESYLEARADPSLDARDLELMDVEAREYLEYLEAREAVTAAATTTTAVTETVQTPPQTPLSATSPPVEVPAHDPTGAGSEIKHHHHHHHKHSHHEVLFAKYQKKRHEDWKLAKTKFEADPAFYQQSLLDSESKAHRYAVKQYLSKPENLHKALANPDSPYYRMAKRIRHHHRAKAYLANKKHFNDALKHKHSKYHRDAIRKYLSHGDHYEHALSDRSAHFHKFAVHEYLRDTETRKSVLADQNSPFYTAAVEFEKARKHRKHHHHKHPESSTATA